MGAVGKGKAAAASPSSADVPQIKEGRASKKSFSSTTVSGGQAITAKQPTKVAAVKIRQVKTLTSVKIEKPIKTRSTAQIKNGGEDKTRSTPRVAVTEAGELQLTRNGYMTKYKKQLSEYSVDVDTLMGLVKLGCDLSDPEFWNGWKKLNKSHE